MNEVKENKKDILENKTLDDVFTLFARLSEKERKSLLDTYSVTAMFRTVRNEDSYKATIEQMDEDIYRAKEALENTKVLLESLEINKEALQHLYTAIKHTDIESSKVYQIEELYKTLDNEKKAEIDEFIKKAKDWEKAIEELREKWEGKRIVKEAIDIVLDAVKKGNKEKKANEKQSN